MRTLPEKLIALVCVAGAALVGYWAWRYEGLYQWLAERQLKWFGSYEAQITFLVALVIVVGPILALAVIARRVVRGAGAAPFPTEAMPQAYPASTRVQLFLGRWGFALTIGIVGIALAAPGVYHLHRGSTAGQITRVTAADFDAGRFPTRHWVSITGDAPIEQSVSLTSSNGGRATFYIPVISENFDPHRGVTLFLKATADDINDDVRAFGNGKFEGMLTTDALPGLVREEFKRREVIPAADYRMLDLGRTPADDVKVGRDMVIFGGIMVVAAGVMALWPWFKSRRAERAAASPAPSVAPSAPDPRFQVKAILPLGTPPPKDPSSP
jgi:hypothetical protein